MLGGRTKRVGHFCGGVLIRYERLLSFFTTSYGLLVQRPWKMSLAFCRAANVPTGCPLGAP